MLSLQPLLERFIMPHNLWTLAALKEACQGDLRGIPSQNFGGVSIDSRSVTKDDIFVAIKGDKMDGHDFVPGAIAQGAGIAIVSRLSSDWPKDLPLLVVKDDPLAALERLGRAARARSHGKVIAVTGSVGKTSTKEMLRVALSASSETHASASSFNNHWGVPLTLSRFSETSGFGVFEIGMNHPGEITPLVGMVKPHIAIITNVAASHLGHFNSLDGIADAKSEIFTGVVEGGHAIINRDSPYYEKMKDAASKAGVVHIHSFGKHAEADVRMEAVALRPDCCCITAILFGEKVTYKLGVPGEHMALNSLVVLATCKLAGADVARAALALADVKPAKGRGGQIKLNTGSGTVLLLDESYNANPASVAAAFALLGTMKRGKNGRRVAVLGDMLELGDFGPELHRELASGIATNDIDLVFTAGPLMRHLYDAIPPAKRGLHAEQSAALVDVLKTALHAGDCVMVKGSLGSRMGPVVEALKTYWPAITEDAA
jgi:UDP-N-acetylmuramoyl-tripeptide--D-alanyl-D-alanine ligase